MKTVAIISQKGGAGKTTLSTHLAVAAQTEGDTVLFDADSQATACQWAEWREAAGKNEPAVIDCGSPALLNKKLRQAEEMGAQFAILDTPPHADIMAREACKVADLVLMPCRPQAYDIAAIQTTADLVKAQNKPAFVVLNSGPVRAPNTYKETQELIESLTGVPVAPVFIPQRAVFHHSSGGGMTALETEPGGKAADEIRQLWTWIKQEVGA